MNDPRTESKIAADILQGVEPLSRLPYGVSRYYASLAQSQDPRADPIAAQFIPTENERTVLPYESGDPIGDTRYLVTDRLIHHYQDRALLLVSDRCATYCRHCFRRHFTGHGGGRITEEQLEAACVYLRRTPRIQELLLSGGDPLMLSDQDLERVIEKLLAVNDRYIIRLCTRMPVVLPARVTEELARMLGNHEGIWVVIHANHPRELTESFQAAMRIFLHAGVPVLNQSVLLRGINDDPDIMEELLRGLVRARVKPYYLFQGDLAAGTSHFRVPMERGIQLMQELRRRVSGIALPIYAVDLPGGAGKVPIESSIVRIEAEALVLRGSDGQEHRYPREP